MNKQKIGILGLAVLLLGSTVYFSSTGKLGDLASNMLANNGCSESFLAKNGDSYTQNKNRYTVVLNQINEIQSIITPLQGRISTENRKINSYNREIQDSKRKIAKEDDTKVIENLREDIQNLQNSIKSSETKIGGYVESIGKYKTDIANLRNTVRAEHKIVTTYETCKKNLSKWPSISTGIMSSEVYMPLTAGNTTILGETMMPEESGIIAGNMQAKAGEMALYTLSVESPQKDIKINSLKFKTTVSKTGQSVDGKIYSSWFIRSQSDNAVCTCTNSSQEYGVYVVECPMTSCRANIKKRAGETYTLFSRDWSIGGTGSMTTRFTDMSYDDDKGGINNLTSPRKLSFSTQTIGTPADPDICTVAPELCNPNYWVAGSWGSCQNGTQTRIVQCYNTTGIVTSSSCSNPQPVSSQSCNNNPINTNSIANFIVTAPTEVHTYQAFDITVKATKSDNTKLSNYTGTVYFDNINHSPQDSILPSFGDNGYKFTTADQGEHTFAKAFTLKKPGTYVFETYEIESNANNGNGVSKQFIVIAKDSPSEVSNSFSGFSLSLPATATVNTPVDLSITAVKTDNSTDTSYNKSAIILIDGDPQAVLPLTAQTLSNGVLSLPNSLVFKSTGTKTVIIKDIVTGIEAKKTITITTVTTNSNQEENENDDNSAFSPIYTALLDNTTGLVYGQDTNIMKLDIAANNKYDILLKTIPVNMRIYTKKLNVSNIKLRDKAGNILDVTMTAVNKVNEFDKDVQLVITFNTPYAIPAGTGTSFSMTGVVMGESNEYDTVATWLGDKKKFTGVNVTLQKPFTGEDIPGYSWNAISLMRR